jgi:hypothetical protein
MATSISIRTLSDDSNGVNDFITLAASSTTLTNNLVRASTLRRIFNDTRFYRDIIQDGAIPATKISGSFSEGSIATQSLSGAIGKNLTPPRNGQLAWYTITPENLAYSAITWNSSKRFGINIPGEPNDTLNLSGGINISNWSTFRTTDSNGRASWYGNATTIDGQEPGGSRIGKYLNAEAATRITQSLGEIIFYRSIDASPTVGGYITWAESFRVNSSGDVSLSGSLTSGASKATSYNINDQGLISYDSTKQSIGFNRSTTRTLDLYTDKAIFPVENITTNFRGNRIANQGYGVFDRILTENNRVLYKVSSTSFNNELGDASGDIFSVTIADSRVGIGGNPDFSTDFSAALKVTGRLEVTSDLKVGGSLSLDSLNVTNNITAGAVTASGLIFSNKVAEFDGDMVNKKYLEDVISANAASNIYNLLPSGSTINTVMLPITKITGPLRVTYASTFVASLNNPLPSSNDQLMDGYNIIDRGGMVYRRKSRNSKLRVRVIIPHFTARSSGGSAAVNMILVLYTSTFGSSNIDFTRKIVVKEFAPFEFNPLELEYFGTANSGSLNVNEDTYFGLKLYCNSALDTNGFYFNCIPVPGANDGGGLTNGVRFFRLAGSEQNDMINPHVIIEEIK